MSNRPIILSITISNNKNIKFIFNNLGLEGSKSETIVTPLNLISVKEK